MRRLGALATAVVVLAGCGGSDSDEGSKTGKAEEALLARTPKPESVKCSGSDEKADCKVTYADGATADCFVSASGSANSISCTSTSGNAAQTWTTLSGGARGWTGTWKTSFGQLELAEQGGRVTGSYEFCDGQLEGTTKGRTLAGQWREEESCGDRREGAQTTGTFLFTLDSGGKSYRGTWSYTDASKNPQDNTWNGERE